MPQFLQIHATAHTAYKYAAFQAFCIPTEGDNDADTTTHDVAAKKTASTPPPAKQADSSGTSQGGSQPKAEKTPPASNTEADTKAAEYHDRIRGALRQIFGEDKGAALRYVEAESAWIVILPDYTRCSYLLLLLAAGRRPQAGNSDDPLHLDTVQLRKQADMVLLPMWATCGQGIL